MLYKAGAKEVHVRIACPEIKYPDFYGVDMPTKKELLSSNKNTNEICDFLGATSCKFLSIDGLYKALLNQKEIIIILNLVIIILLVNIQLKHLIILEMKKLHNFHY